MVEKWIQDDLEAFLSVLPPRIYEPLRQLDDLHDLLEVVLDLGRPPEARFPSGDVILDPKEVAQQDLESVVEKVGEFGGDNRAGIERTLHRISAIRNRKGEVIGLTCRVGRAVFGTIRIIEDLVLSGKSVLLMGRPGVGKTTMLREVARVLADDAKKRVIIVDTSNEIAGDGDIPHPAIGHARRMQVATPSLQHAVMIEAVENHMPEVIIIDEMGTELEAAAARTIAERGVQLIATAHGNTLENLILNPTLSDLLGGIQAVTLGDEEARRRGTQKTILERKAPPTFDMVVEIQEWERVAVHDDVAQVVDLWLRGHLAAPESRRLDESGRVIKTKEVIPNRQSPSPPQTREAIPHPSQTGASPLDNNGAAARVLPFGVGRERLLQASADMGVNVELAKDVSNADVVLTTKTHYRRGARILKAAEESNKPIYVVRRNSVAQMRQFLKTLAKKTSGGDYMDEALTEAQEAAQRIMDGEKSIPLSPQTAYIRKLQHMLAEKYKVLSVSMGREPNRRVTFYGR